MRTSNTRRRVTALAAGLLALAATACQPILLPDGTPLGPPPPRTGGIGMNLAAVADWSPELPFVDVVKSARPWTSNRVGGAWGSGGSLATDADGWITSLAPDQYATMVLLNIGGHYPSGRWILRYEGAGTLRLDWPNGRVVSQSPGRWEIDVAPGTTGAQLHELATDPADPIRNVQLIMPGYEATAAIQPFNPTFLRVLQPFDQLRFVWWMRTSAQAAPGGMTDWSARTTPTYAFQSDHGVAVEYMVQLANTLGVDPWFTMPHDASDAYVRSFATLVRDRLRPGLTAWVEYSNETWNGGYPQSSWVMEHGTALGLSADPFQAGFRYHARRAQEMWAVWEQVFGGRTRFKRVLAAQAGNPWTGRQVVEAAQGSAGADAIAIAPYFNCVRDLAGSADGAAQIIAMTDDQVLDRCLAEIRGPLTTALTQYRDLAAQWGLELVAYEGGQHMIGLGSQAGNTALAAKLNQVNRTPRMGDVYREYLALWRSLGLGQFNALGDVSRYDTWGSFGALEWQDQDPATAPKYLALVEAAR